MSARNVVKTWSVPESFSPTAEQSDGAEKAIMKQERASFDFVKQVLDVIGS